MASVFLSGVSSNASKVIETQISAFQSGDIATAYNALSPNAQKATSQVQFQAFIQKHQLQNAESVQFTSQKFTDGTAELRGTIKFQGGETRPVFYQLVKNDDEWNVQLIRFQEAE